MFFAIAALLIRPNVVPQTSFSADKIALLQPAESSDSTSAGGDGIPLPLVQVHADLLMPPVTGPVAPSNARAAEPAPAPADPLLAVTLPKPRNNMTVSVQELIAEGRRNQRIWLGLGIASHSAATFDAWSTRRAITSGGGRELDPLLRPFAGNGSLYAAIQVGPALMDYLGRKMMYSRHGWMRRMWWLPQSASIVGSLASGGHNLGVRPPVN